MYLFLLQGKISKDLFCSGNIICSFEVFQHFTKKNYVVLNPHDTPCVREEIFIKIHKFYEPPLLKVIAAFMSHVKISLML